MHALDASGARRWAEFAVSDLERDRAAIDRINVYPVADGDTGTNLLLTMRAAAAEPVHEGAEASAVVAALARGALAGARGNSGMLVSQVLRGLAEATRDDRPLDGSCLCDALLRADDLARHAIAQPAEGTLLSVLRAASDAASACGSTQLDEVTRVATEAAVDALGKTTGQLAELASAGVVDAGGRGLVVLLDALHAVVHRGTRLAAESPAAPLSAPPVSLEHDSAFSYEVMYLLDGATDGTAAELRTRLAALGDCVSVAGDGRVSWAVHVHCDDIGAAIESGIESGRVHRIRVTRFADQVAAASARRVVVACVRGEALAELFTGEGAEVVAVGTERPLGTDDLVAAIERVGARDVVVLPNDETVTPLAEDAAGRSVRAGIDVVVVPTASPTQGLAALAVHDPLRRTADDTVAMAEAAAATRRGELMVAAREALTWVGTCQAGDVLGMIDGDVVLIDSELCAAACSLSDRMLGAGGELVTVLVGEQAPATLGERLAAHLHRTRPEVELACYPAGDLGAAVMIGVE